MVRVDTSAFSDVRSFVMSYLKNSSNLASATVDGTRLIVGLIWLCGAVYNVSVTSRMADPYGWFQDSPLRPYRWFFGEVAGVHPTFWTMLLALGELSLAVLTLARGGWARVGLAGGALFSLFLFASGLSYTLMMGPYALLLAWLARHTYPNSAITRLRGLTHLGRTRSTQ
jgi:hypothetical protein